MSISTISWWPPKKGPLQNVANCVSVRFVVQPMSFTSDETRDCILAFRATTRAPAKIQACNFSRIWSSASKASLRSISTWAWTNRKSSTKNQAEKSALLDGIPMNGQGEGSCKKKAWLYTRRVNLSRRWTPTQSLPKHTNFPAFIWALQ